jgi:hypothetical protein
MRTPITPSRAKGGTAAWPAPLCKAEETTDLIPPAIPPTLLFVAEDGGADVLVPVFDVVVRLFPVATPVGWVIPPFERLTPICFVNSRC